ncbi:ATP-binding cassette domain-containing protein [Anaerovorax odorimutans]|uniref:ATP-binding cassette domain-containing protein n=1 Tax=Anaerovorax odorimutans TaxID=109327 RepID=A0ABT1RQV0_9FIRM|nr:ATP-binding cassette domain-containing protein [Anaerovorax odorimutans]MCQ4637574.1 ATP-binding cassette domain-containing protein [Anaerovorax odorimutans]
MATALAVQTKNLCKTFNGKEVIKNCNMSVESGTIYGFLGKNGAGKTTVFKLLLGLLKPTMGQATVLGMDSVQNNLEILKRTGSLIETPVFYEHLSAFDNLQIHLEYMNSPCTDIKDTLEAVGLFNVGTQPVSAFSLGMRQRLGIARAIIHRPDLLILDEPINGLDPVGIREMRGLFKRLANQEGLTILLSSHILSEIEQIADRIGILAEGSILQEISPQEIKEKYPSGMEDYFMSITNGGVLNE